MALHAGRWPEAARELDLAEFEGLPRTHWRGDIHCVTKWSKFDTSGKASRSTTCSPRPESHAPDAVPPRAVVRRLRHQRAGRRSRRRPRDDRHALRGRAAWRRSTAARRACWCRTSTSGRARSGFEGAALHCPRRSRASGSSAATTCTAIPGASSVTRTTHDAARGPPRPLAGGQIVRIAARTPRVDELLLRAPLRPHAAGQHLDVRLTAEDGYQAQRGYSIAPRPASAIELAIEELADGEVSPYFHEVAQVGRHDRGSRSRSAATSCGARDGGPMLLVGGGSGVAPLMSMVRHRTQARRTCRRCSSTRRAPGTT